ncbi:MAG: NUDIX domain-containing protein [Deltaproteobacteria bacterium]|nr:NUDIX domain-containing protein [Deltaproteobacteria bacterium]
MKIVRDARIGPLETPTTPGLPATPTPSETPGRTADRPGAKALAAIGGPSTRNDAPPAIGRYQTPAKTAVSTHIKARTEKPASYPDRFPVPDAKVTWTKPYPEYAPADFVAAVVLANAGPKGWADPPEVKDVSRPMNSYTGPVGKDERGRPLNPMGRTGIEGRGLLGRWGANYAADPIVTRTNPKTHELEMLAIRRKDSGEWAIPGGMVDEGEEVSATLAREFLEETGVNLSMTDAKLVFRGYADDPRNTDNAWMETTVKHKHLSADEASKMEPKAGDDAAAVAWMPLTPANVGKLYGNHSAFVRLAMQSLESS